MAPDMNRRKFLGSTAASAAALTIVPRHVLGGPAYVAPSDKITLAYIGCGTQGFREMPSLLASPDVQIVAVCDPNKDSTDYVDWSKEEIPRLLRRTMGKPNWREGMQGIPGGREVGREFVDGTYANSRSSENYKGCTAYADFRELLETEKDLDAVKIMTPDHLHATIAIAAMKKGKHVAVHKPLANRLAEARLVIDTARKTKVATHFLPASDGTMIRVIADWIKDGAIGTLREVHNWSSRPFWPQYPTIPTDTPPVPDGFDWDLWLGPVPNRPYHPHFTHAVFRGWYDFGGGSIADMGHYSLWSVFTIFDLDAPISVESTVSHACSIVDQVSRAIANNYSFPDACTIRFKFAAKGDRPALELFWYDGGMRPRKPEELEEDNKEFSREGMMFVGDKGKILAGFYGDNPQIIPERKMREFRAALNMPAPTPPQPPARGQGGTSERDKAWIEAFKAGRSAYGDFLLGGPISDMVNLGAISLRLGGRKLLFDSENMKVTNVPEANKYLSREYRQGWELTGV
jgi:predicted dehydrogenase